MIGSGSRTGSRLLLAAATGLLSATAQGTDIEVKTLGATAQAAAETCSRCMDGDIMISNGALDVVIGGSHRRDESFYKFPTSNALGSILFLRPAGTDSRGDIMVGAPHLRVNDTTRHVRYEDFDVLRAEDVATVSATGFFRDEEGTHLRFQGEYAFSAGSPVIEISLSVTNMGAEPLAGLLYSIFFDPHQVYDFSPANAAAHRRLKYRGYPRGGQLSGWVDSTPRLATPDSKWGWDGGMILPDPVGVDLAPGASDTRSYTLISGRTPRPVLQQVYEKLGVSSARVSFDFASDSKDYLELVVRDRDSKAVFFRTFLDRPETLTIELPEGTYEARAHFFPGTADCSFTVARQETGGCRLEDPPPGAVKVSIVDTSGATVPGKVTFHGIGPTPRPYFRPENPAYDDGYWESVKNSVFPVHEAREVVLPVGSYTVTASRGPLYSIDQRAVHISKQQTAVLQFVIERVIDRPDLVSLDSHLHTRESDGAVDVDEKIRAIVAEGIDVAVATDHNYPVDYRPALEALGLDNELIVVAGAEVTVPERLDYNTYPMEVHRGRYNHGAIGVLSKDLRGRFNASRARDEGVIVQVNHPRYWQFDYFNWHDLDPESAAYANEGFDLSFDVLEVVNGAIYDTPENRAARKDWFNLLRRGYFFPLVGTSDSHEVDQDEPGYSRTWIYRKGSPAAPVILEELMQNVREGRSFASNGPILDLTVSGGFRPGDTVTMSSGAVRLQVDVMSADWIEATAVQVYVNGEPIAVPLQPVRHATATHLRGYLDLKLDRDAFLVGEVRGSRDLSPVVQRRSGATGEETPVLPFALTNPLFVDVDGNGTYDAPLPNRIEIRPLHTGGPLSP